MFVHLLSEEELDCAQYEQHNHCQLGGTPAILNVIDLQAEIHDVRYTQILIFCLKLTFTTSGLRSVERFIMTFKNLEINLTMHVAGVCSK